MQNNADHAFMKCSKCGHIWTTRDDFLDDPEIQIVGYQADFEVLTAGLFLFNHACKTTLAVKAGAFSDLYTGPIFSQRKTGTEACPERCLHCHDLEPCPEACECAFVREILQIIRQWRKPESIKSA